MSFVPVEEPTSSLEDDVLRLLRKPRNTARKRAMKKIKVSEDTRTEVSTPHYSSRVVCVSWWLLTTCYLSYCCRMSPPPTEQVKANRL
jgi:hypothetical protein